MKILINREDNGDIQKDFQFVNWYIPTGIRYPDPKFTRLEYSFRLCFEESKDGSLFLREEYCDVEGRYQNLIDMWPPLDQVKIEEEKVISYLEQLKQHHLTRAGLVESFMKTLEKVNNPPDEED